MSDHAQGPGWWQASDGKWYPPEQRPAWPPPEPGGEPGAGPDRPGDQPGVPWSRPAPGYQRPTGEKGFFGSLYDPSFDSFVTPRLLRVFYVIVLGVLTAGAVLFFLGTLVGGLSEGNGGAVAFAIIAVPVGYLMYVIFTRIYFELIAALFRIADDLRAIRRDRGS